MVKRRSFEDGLSADTAAFLKEGKVKPRATKQKAKSPPKSKPKKQESLMSKPALKPKIIENLSPSPIAAASAMWCNLSVRIDQRLAAAILRAMTERKIAGLTPATQQNIVAEAMVDWLKRNGHTY